MAHMDLPVWIQEQLSAFKDLSAVLVPCTSSSRTKCRHKAAGMAVGVNVQFTKHLHKAGGTCLSQVPYTLPNYLHFCLLIRST